MRKIKRNGFLLLGICILAIGGYGCSKFTDDYAVDETNYHVSVPDILSKKIKNCELFVYRLDGEHKGQLSASMGYSDSGDDPLHQGKKVDPRVTQRGIFCFKLDPGKYEVFCYRNVADLDKGPVYFKDMNTKDHGGLALRADALESSKYQAPEDNVALYHFVAKPIQTPGVVVQDQISTGNWRRYPCKVIVHFKNFPQDMIDQLDHLEVDALNASTFQDQGSFSDTIPDFNTIGDEHFLKVPADINKQNQTIDVNTVFFPSAVHNQDKTQPVEMTLNFKFLNEAGNAINSTKHAVLALKLDKKGTQIPIHLYTGSTVEITLDKFELVDINVIPWSYDSDDNNDIDAN